MWSTINKIKTTKEMYYKSPEINSYSHRAFLKIENKK